MGRKTKQAGLKPTKHKLDFDELFYLAKEKHRKKCKKSGKKISYYKADYIKELEEEQGINLTVRNLDYMKGSLPYTISVLVAMAKKAGVKIEDIILDVE